MSEDGSLLLQPRLLGLRRAQARPVTAWDRYPPVAVTADAAVQELVTTVVGGLPDREPRLLVPQGGCGLLAAAEARLETDARVEPDHTLPALPEWLDARVAPGASPAVATATAYRVWREWRRGRRPGSTREQEARPGHRFDRHHWSVVVVHRPTLIGYLVPEHLGWDAVRSLRGFVEAMDPPVGPRRPLLVSPPRATD